MRDLMKFGQDCGSNEYGNYLSRLGARADTGMGAAQMSGQASQQAAAGVSNALGNIGNTQAAGAIGQANTHGPAGRRTRGPVELPEEHGGTRPGPTAGFFNWLFGGNGLGALADGLDIRQGIIGPPERSGDGPRRSCHDHHIAETAGCLARRSAGRR